MLVITTESDGDLVGESEGESDIDGVSVAVVVGMSLLPETV